MKWITSCNVICQQLFEVLLTCMQGVNSTVNLHVLSQSSCYGQIFHVWKLCSDRQWCLCHKAMSQFIRLRVWYIGSEFFTHIIGSYQLSQFVQIVIISIMMENANKITLCYNMSLLINFAVWSILDRHILHQLVSKPNRLVPDVFKKTLCGGQFLPDK